MDFDNTLADSQRAFIKTYSILHNIPTTKTYAEKWDFTDVFPIITKEEITQTFTSDLFFALLKPIDGAVESVKAMTDTGKPVYIVTLSHPKIVQKKVEWIQRYFPSATVIPIISTRYDKSVINMEDATFVDDRPDILNGSNAKTKIMFKCKGDCDWQQGWKGIFMYGWNEENWK